MNEVFDEYGNYKFPSDVTVDTPNTGTSANNIALSLLIETIRNQNPKDYLPFSRGEIYDGWQIAIDRVVEIIQQFDVKDIR